MRGWFSLRVLFMIKSYALNIKLGVKKAYKYFKDLKFYYFIYNSSLFQFLSLGTFSLPPNSKIRGFSWNTYQCSLNENDQILKSEREIIFVIFTVGQQFIVVYFLVTQSYYNNHLLKALYPRAFILLSYILKLQNAEVLYNMSFT